MTEHAVIDQLFSFFSGFGMGYFIREFKEYLKLFKKRK